MSKKRVFDNKLIMFIAGMLFAIIVFDVFNIPNPILLLINIVK